MRTFACIFISFACFLSCSNTWSSSEIGNNRNVSVEVTNEDSKYSVNRDQDVQPAATPVATTTIRKAFGSFTVDIYEDGALFTSLFFRDGLLVKGIGYNTETKKKEGETTYFYKKNGEFDHAKINGALVSNDDQIEIDRSFGDFDVKYDFLKSKGIDFPLADVVPDEVSDLSDVLSIAEGYSDFKTENLVEGNKRVLKFIDFNKTHRFHNSPMALLIGNGDFINIKDYELTLENGFPLKEVYGTRDGELTKTYSYKDGKMTGVVYQFTDLKNQTNSLKKRFEYHELNQKP